MNSVHKLRGIIYFLCLQSWLITSVTESHEGVPASEAFLPSSHDDESGIQSGCVPAELHRQVMLVEPTEASHGLLKNLYERQLSVCPLGLLPKSVVNTGL